MNNTDALIRVTHAGICNTDLEIIKGYMGFQGVLGHEFVGIVEKCSNDDLIGKRVVGEINIPCRTCTYCINKMTNHCPNRSVIGILERDGAFADYISLPLDTLHTLPDSISDEEAVFVEPLAAAFEILEQVTILPADKVCVLGDGKLGLLVAQVLSLTDCKLTAVGHHNEKLSILDELGIKTKMHSAFRDKAFDIVVDCTGSSSGLKTAIEIVKPRGKVILKTTVAKKVYFDTNSIVVKEIELVGSRCGPFGPALKAIESRNIDLYSLISREFSIEEGIQAIQYAMKKDTLKVILKIA
jgi:threonine dehydrogenase-like Zn-dependent dehydrogenase